MNYRRFSDCSVSEKLLDTLFILLLGVGYLFAMFLIYVTVAPMDGKPGLSIRDIAFKYHGNRSGTRLEQALKGGMRLYHLPDEHEAIVSWIYDGASRPQFEKKVEPIFEKKCINCHNPDFGMNIPDLTSYEKVMDLVKVNDNAPPFGALVRVSHIHLFGLSFIFYLLGRIFILSEMPLWLKRTIVAVPFISIAMDIGSWWFTRYAHIFSYTVLIGGTLMGFSFAVQSLVSLYQMWLYKPKGEG